ncbi:DUF397 domain-containing protein [Spirillospora sp. NPDC052269]
MEWRKASRSTSDGGECVGRADLEHVAGLSGRIGVRDSKNPTGPALALPKPAAARPAASLLGPGLGAVPPAPE